MTEEKELGKIEYTHLGFEDHGIMSFMIGFDFGTSGQGFGGYALDNYDKEVEKRIGTAYGMEAIMRILRATGVEKWEDLVGKVCWVYREEQRGNIVAIEAPEFTKHGEKFNIEEFNKNWADDHKNEF